MAHLTRHLGLQAIVLFYNKKLIIFLCVVYTVEPQYNEFGIPAKSFIISDHFYSALYCEWNSLYQEFVV